MSVETLETDELIARAKMRNSPTGLFRRFVKGRLGGFAERLIMTLIAGVAIALLVSLEWAALVVTLTLVGEVFERMCLLRWVRQLDAGADVAPILKASALVGAAQAATVVCGVSVAWFAPTESDTTFFCLAYLCGAAMNAGLPKSLHPMMANAKLCVYLLATALFFGIDLFFLKGMSAHVVFNLIGAAMMSYLVHAFVGYAASSFEKQRRASDELLQGQKEFELKALELKEKQKELRMLSMVARQANDSVILSDTDRKIFWVNDAFTRVTGYSSAEAIGLTPAVLMNAPDTDLQQVALLEERIQSGLAHRTELLCRRKDGREIWVETNVVPVVGEQDTVEMFVAVERDITQAKEHEQELGKARRDAERGERAKSEFLATMSHEIRTPMNGIVGMADLLCEADLPKQQREYAATIQSSAQALLKIINDILDFSKLDAGKLVIDPVDFAPGPCVLDAVDLLRPHANEKDLYLDVNFETRLPSRLHGDDGRLRQIVLNLVGNAIKFTNEGGVNIAVRHDHRDQDIMLRICVQDTGIGIPKDKLEQVFGHFSQADTATTRQFGGTGLGLSISRLLAREMGGDITLESAQGEGSKFTVTLRMEEPIGSQKPEQQSLSLDDPKVLENARILLADDNRTNRVVVERFLASLPVDLVSVENGKEALDAVMSEEFDVVLMDMSMPVMDGLEATREIRQAGRTNLEIIALTANAFATDRTECLAAGMDDFLSKPVNRKELISAIQHAVVRRANRHQNRRMG